MTQQMGQNKKTKQNNTNKNEFRWIKLKKDPPLQNSMIVVMKC